jgi:predicted transcriptional regulator
MHEREGGRALTPSAHLLERHIDVINQLWGHIFSISFIMKLSKKTKMYHHSFSVSHNTFLTKMSENNNFTYIPD